MMSTPCLTEKREAVVGPGDPGFKEKLLDAFHVSADTKYESLFKDEKYYTAFRALKNAFERESGVYVIHGPSGTGKTSTVKNILQHELQAKSYLWFNERFSKSDVQKLYTARIIVFDEFDLYQSHVKLILDKLKKTRMIVILCNSYVEFPGAVSISFKAYDANGLHSIVKNRLRIFKARVFEESALKFMCRKVAKTSGDARDLLNKCSTAIANMNFQNIETISIDDLRHSFEEIIHDQNNSLELKVVIDLLRTKPMNFNALHIELNGALSKKYKVKNNIKKSIFREMVDAWIDEKYLHKSKDCLFVKP